MGLFDEACAEVASFLRERRERGEVREYPLSGPGFTPVWPEEKSLVMKADTAVELGNPDSASLMLLLWTSPGTAGGEGICVVGPDLGGAETGNAAGVSSLPFGQVVIAAGDFGDEYGTYREIREAVYNFDLEGVTSRSLPSSQSAWLRVSRGALAEGFSLEVLGKALASRVRRVPGVTSVRVLLLTDAEAIEELRSTGDKAASIVAALTRMCEEMEFDCDSCEFVEVCDEVSELREIRDKLRREA